MKKILFPAFFLTTVIHFAFAQTDDFTKAKLSPLTMQYLLKTKNYTRSEQLIPGYVYKTDAENIHYISALIKVNNNIQESLLNQYGVHIGTKAGNIWTAQIPIGSIQAFTRLAGMDYIQLDEPIIPTLDSLRRVTHVDSVQAGYGLPMPYNGKNVVIGIVDVGFDYGHPEFFDTTGVGFRIKKVWEQKTTTGTPPSGFIYGTEMTDSIEILSQGSDNKSQTHGTHVAGICAGAGFGGSTDNRKYRGIAYKSDIVLVGILPDKDQWVNTGISDIVDGINYIFKYAESVGKPAVVNLSWGSPLGPRDGSSLFGTALDNLTGPGKIFVCSAGNNGTDSIHVQKDFSVTDTLVQTFIQIANTPIGKRAWVDIWGDTGKTFCAKVTLYHNRFVAGDSTGFICLDNNTHDFFLIGANNDTCFVTVTTSSSEFNEQSRIFLDLNSKVNDSICISIKGTEGKINMWNEYVNESAGYQSPFDNLKQPWAVKGDSRMTISDLACSKSAITIGAYSSKLSWKNINGVTMHYNGYGKIAPFSSKGPTSDGKVKPDITAPGFFVISGVSSYDPSVQTGGSAYQFITNKYHSDLDGRDYPFAAFAGTSMSSPAVAGIVGLMLEAFPYLDPQQVKDILAETAIKDKYTGSIPSEGSNTWGSGKVNAYAAIKKTIGSFAGINKMSSGSLDFDVFPNPGNGYFTINYITEKSEKIKLRVCDLPGRIISSQDWNVTAGDNSRRFDLTSFSKGLYFIKLSSQNGFAVTKVVVE